MKNKKRRSPLLLCPIPRNKCYILRRDYYFGNKEINSYILVTKVDGRAHFVTLSDCIPIHGSTEDELKSIIDQNETFYLKRYITIGDELLCYNQEENKYNPISTHEEYLLLLTCAYNY